MKKVLCGFFPLRGSSYEREREVPMTNNGTGSYDDVESLRLFVCVAWAIACVRINGHSLSQEYNNKFHRKTARERP